MGKAFTNYLAVIPGVSGIPLSYIIHKDDNPDEKRTYESFNVQYTVYTFSVLVSCSGDFMRLQDNH